MTIEQVKAGIDKFLVEEEYSGNLPLLINLYNRYAGTKNAIYENNEENLRAIVETIRMSLSNKLSGIKQIDINVDDDVIWLKKYNFGYRLESGSEFGAIVTKIMKDEDFLKWLSSRSLKIEVPKTIAKYLEEARA